MAGWSWEKPGASAPSAPSSGWSWDKAAPHSGGGLFNWLGSKADLAWRDLKATPGGLYTAGKTAWLPAYDLARGRPGNIGRDFRQGYNIDKQMVTGSLAAIHHPLRDPFQTALTIAPAIGVAGRVGEAGIAARAAETGSRLDAATEALLQRGGQPVRLLRAGDQQNPVALIGSRNPGVRLFAQRPYDRMLQKALDREQAAATGEAQPLGRVGSRIAAHARARIGGVGGEELRIQQRMAQVPSTMLDQAARRLARLKLPGEKRLSQAALELTSQQVPAEEASAYHFGRAEQGGADQAAHTAAGKLYEKLAQRGVVHVNDQLPAGQKVYINPQHEKLAAADAELAKVQKRTDTLLAENKVMTPEQLQGRVDAPGRIRAGASYESPTPGKLGIEAAGHTQFRKFVTRLEGRSARADERVQRMEFTAADRKRLGEAPGTPLDAVELRDQMRPLEKELRQLTEEWNAPAKQGGRMSREEAQARFEELDAKLESLKERLIPHVSPYGDRAANGADRAQLARNTEWGKKVRSYKAAVRQQLKRDHKDWTKERLAAAVDAEAARMFPKPQTVKSEELALAEEKIHELAAKGTHPVFRQAADLLREHENLRRLLTAEDPFYEGPREPMPLKPGAEGSPYEQRAELHRTLREGTAAERQVKRFADKAGTDATVHGLAELQARADALTEKIDELRGKPGPDIVALRKEVADLRKQIREAERARPLNVAGDRPFVMDEKGNPVYPKHYQRAERISAGLSVARDRLQQLEDAAARRVKPTGIVGGETARPGRGYTFEGINEKKLPRTEAARSQGPVTGIAGEPISKRPFTGAAIESGVRPNDITGVASRHLRAVQRFVNTDRMRRWAIKTDGSAVRRSDHDGLVAVPGETQPELTATMREALGQRTSTVDKPGELDQHLGQIEQAREEGLHAVLQMQRQHLIDTFRGSQHNAVGTHADPGYVWVSEKVMGRLLDESPSRGGPGQMVGRGIDDVNSAVTAATVYTKIGHVFTRYFTNAATNIMQGSAAPHEIADSTRTFKALDETDQARVLAAGGQAGFAALPVEGRDWIGGFAKKGAQFWARHADAPFRANSILYELRSAGYRTPEQVKVALDALEHHGDGLPAHEWSKISVAARRADREAISYDRLNSFEKRYLTRLVWFYPWIKGSTVFTVRSLLEHPWKAAAIGAAGAYGRKQQLKQLGPTPSYESGLFQIGGGQSPLTTDFSTFSPFSTAADVGFAVNRPQDFAGFANPAIGAIDQLVHGLNAYGAPSKKPYLDALLAIAAATPEQQFAESFGQGNQSNRMFRKTPQSTLLRYLLGPATPRHVNKAALAKAAARERSGQR